MIGRRDTAFLKAHLLLLVLLFAPLLLRPRAVPRNMGDLYAYHYPLRHLAASTMQEGRLPLWNPYILAGVPLSANPQAQLFYPPAALWRVLPLPWAFSLDAFLHLALALLGAHLLLRRRGLEPLGAWALSLSYGLSPFVLGRLAQGIPTLLAALAWCPWVWLAACSESPLLLGGTLALQGLSGHPQFALVNLAGLAFWCLIRRRGALLAKACAWAALLSAAQALPTLEYLRLSVRALWDPSYAAGYSLAPRHLLSYLSPWTFGSPLAGAFEHPSEYFEMMSGYIGLAPLALGLLGGPPAAWGLAGAGLFLALGSNNPLLSPLSGLLGLDFLRVPSRFSFLILWGLWLSASSAWPELRRRLPKPQPVVVALIILVDMAWHAAPWIVRQDPGAYLGANPPLAALLRGPFRHATAPEIVLADKAMMTRTLNASGYEAFYPASIAVYTAKSERGPAADGSRTYVRRFPTPELSRLSVRYHVSPQGLRENRAAQPLVQGASAWTNPRPELWVIDAPGPVLVSQNRYPGWRAWAGGKPIEVRTADGIFPALTPPPGGARIRFRFLPGSLCLGLLASLGALLALLVKALRWTY